MSNFPDSVFLLGVGGMGMTPLAIYLAQAGVEVHGFDDDLSDRSRELLEGSGVNIEV